MRLIEVGKIFEEGKTQYQEGCKFDFDEAGGKLFIFFDNPTKEEIENVGTGAMKIGIWHKSDIIFLLWKFGSMEWMDTPYSVHLSKGLVLQQIEPNMGYGITIFLINAKNGILEALRYISFSEKFSWEFYNSVKNQRLMIYDLQFYERDLKTIYANYTTKDIVNFAKTERIGSDEKR